MHRITKWLGHTDASLGMEHFCLSVCECELLVYLILSGEDVPRPRKSVAVEAGEQVCQLWKYRGR